MSGSERDERSESSEPEKSEDDDEVMEDESEEDLGDNAGEPADTGIAGPYNSTDVNDQVFDELHLPEEVVSEVQTSWEAFLRSGSTRDAAGEAVYSAVFDAAPSLKALFKTPRAVMAMRFISGLNAVITSLHEPSNLKTVVETLGFQHLELEVTVPRVSIFRDAIVDLLTMELEGQFSTRAREGMLTALNYVGGAYIYIRVNYSERLRILASSWATANNKLLDENGEYVTAQMLEEGSDEKRDNKKDGNKKGRERHKEGELGGSGSSDGDTGAFKNTTVPTNFDEMFTFNAAVMGFADRQWMNEVLTSFDTIVRNVSNSGRLQEECDVLSLRISKFPTSSITLSEYKAVMLASLRSLVPKDWSGAHEVAWSWLWENVERLLKVNIGKPAVNQKALNKLIMGFDSSTRATIRREQYSAFFELAPAGQEHFKQSATRLDFIADQIIALTMDMYKDPVKLVTDLSAIGLRHVGYGIPPELFGPFVSASVKVIGDFTEDETAKEAYRWSLGLMSRILMRVISEGSTIVMKAINVNSGKQLRKAISCAPRAKRALWMLNVQVGTQSISPLLWAIQTGSLEAAKAMIIDLLTIRADRDRYYFGADTMFERHPDIMKRLGQDAPELLPTLLDGLIWRSRTTEEGMRRVNYYVKHLIVNGEGHFAQSIEWMVDRADPKIICHPCLALVVDIVWSRVAFRVFLWGKIWLVFTLIIFLLATAIFDRDTNSEIERAVVMGCRVFTYFFSMCPRIYANVRQLCINLKTHETVTVYGIPMPRYLMRSQEVVCILLAMDLVLMLVFEPVLTCLGSHEGDFEGAGLFTQSCEAGKDVRFTYAKLSIIGIFLYFISTIDLSVFSTRVSAFVLVCFRIMGEVALYLFAMVFVILVFSCGIAALDQDNPDFSSIPQNALTLMKVSLMLFDTQSYTAMQDYPSLLITVVLYTIVVVTFLLNVLIAQLNCAYSCVYSDIVGYARLNRGKIVVECMHALSKPRWERFIEGLGLDEPCEFSEGDIGMAGAIQVFEPASQNNTTTDQIRRYGGSTAPTAQWPDEEQDADSEGDRFAKMEKLLEKAMKRMAPKSGRSKKGSTGQNSSYNQSSMAGSRLDDGASDAGSGDF